MAQDFGHLLQYIWDQLSWALARGILCNNHLSGLVKLEKRDFSTKVLVISSDCRQHTFVLMTIDLRSCSENLFESKDSAFMALLILAKSSMGIVEVPVIPLPDFLGMKRSQGATPGKPLT